MSKSDPFKYFKTSSEIIRLVVMCYVRYLLLILSSLLLLSGCTWTAPWQTQVVGGWNDRPINALQAVLGMADDVQPAKEGTRYIWRQSDTRWVTTTPSYKTAGLKMVNGRNVATIRNGAPIRTMQSVSCSVTATVNQQDRIIDLTTTSNGMSCQNLLSKL